MGFVYLCGMNELRNMLCCVVNVGACAGVWGTLVRQGFVLFVLCIFGGGHGMETGLFKL